jgi:hypothetical protein
MISDTKFLEQDEQILNIFKEEGSSFNGVREDSAKERVPRELTIEDLKRIDRIVQKAKFSVVAKHSISFLFKTIGVGVSELTMAFIGAAKSANLPTRPLKTKEYENDRADKE